MVRREESRMKKFVILGAGQFGKICALLFQTSNYQLLAFGDNNKQIQDTTFSHPLGMEIPVVSVEKAIGYEPDYVFISVMDEERTRQLLEQVKRTGYAGEYIFLKDLYEILDIRSATLLRIVARLQELHLCGDVAELGVYRGDTAWKINALFPEQDLYLFDTFQGFDNRDVEKERESNLSHASENDFSDTSEELVRRRLPHPEKAIICKGFFPETTKGLEEKVFQFVSLDADLYAPILAGLEYFYPRLCQGGMILLHDYNNARFQGAKQAVKDYEQKNGKLMLIPLCDLHGSAIIIHP